jgi:hypothetical protein
MTEIINRIVRGVQHMRDNDIDPQRVDLTTAAFAKLEKEMIDAGNTLDQNIAEGWPDTIVGLPFAANPRLTYSAVVGNGEAGRVHVMV